MTAQTQLRPATADDEDSDLAWALRDSWALAKRNLRTISRQPMLLVFATIQPVIFILLFRFVFGGAITAPGSIDYVNYLLTGIFVQTITFASIQTGIGLSEDLSKGIVDRFKAMPLSRAAVLAGRTGADLVRNFVVILVMIAVGLRGRLRVHQRRARDRCWRSGCCCAWGFVFTWSRLPSSA
jgi:ABC-2 type transport system permease protein/oleandomycin transport system permease protein